MIANIGGFSYNIEEQKFEAVELHGFRTDVESMLFAGAASEETGTENVHVLEILLGVNIDTIMVYRKGVILLWTEKRKRVWES